MTRGVAPAGHPAHGHALEGVSRVTLVLTLFAIYIVGAHLRLSIYSGDSILLPMYPMLLSAGALALLFLNPLVRAVGGTFALFAAFVLLQPALSLAPRSISIDTLLASLQLLVSVASALAVICALATIERPRLRRMLIWIWAAVMALAVIESAGLKPVFDEIRTVLYAGSGRFLYFAELRDLEIYGRVRTTVFASEPSFLADTLTALTLMVFFLDLRRGNLGSWARLGVMLSASFLVAPSFKMAFYVVSGLVWHFWPRNIRTLLTLLGSVAVTAVLLVLVYEPVSVALYAAVGRHLESGSFFGRIGVAPSVGWHVLTTYPLFGYGIGNENGLYPIIAQVWQDSGAFYRFPWYLELPATDLMSNGFWWSWSFLGLIGGALFCMLTLLMLARIGVEAPLRTLVCVWIVWYAGFAFVDPHSWYMVVVFSVGGVASHVARNPTAFRLPRSA